MLRNPGAMARHELARLQQAGGGPGPVPFTACTENVLLNSGVPYNDDTSLPAYSNIMGAYLGLPWDESGPEVVHKITLSQPSDLRAALLDWEDGQDLDVIILAAPCNSDNWLVAGDYVAVYENAPAGDYYIAVDGYQGDAGTYRLMVAAAFGILLVDDDGSNDPAQNLPDVRSYYTDAFARLGYTASIWDVGFLGAPDEATLYNARLIMWICGGSFDAGMTLTTTDQNNLAGYVYSGGRLYLEGQDILWDIMGGLDGRTGDGTFMSDWMNVNAVTHDVGAPGATVNGALGDPIGDDANSGTPPTTFNVSNSPYSQFTDALSSRFGEPAFYTADRRPAAIRYSDGISRTLFLGFSPANDASTADADALVDRSITWLTESSYCFWGYSGISEAGGFTGDANGYADPGESMTFALQVTNNSGAAANVEVYLGAQDSFLTMGTTYRNYGSIADGASASQNFTFTVNALTPVGYEMNLLFNVFVDGVYCHSITFGSFVGQPEMLLVKDEVLFPNTTGVDVYAGVLDQLNAQGYTHSYAVWDTARFGSPSFDSFGLANDRMKNYWAVWWFTGADFFFTLDAADETELSLYMDAGGRLLLSSQDYLWEKYAGASGPIGSGFPYTHLRLAAVQQDTASKADATLQGVAGEWMTEFTNYNLRNAQVFSNFADTVTPRPGARGILNIAGAPSAVFYRGVSGGLEYRLVFMPFAFENIFDALPPNAKWRLTEKILCYFQQGLPTTPPPCGYFGPAGVGDTLLPDAAWDFFWAPVTLNTAGEGATLQYRVYRASVPNPPDWLAQPYTTRATPDYDPSGDSGPLTFYKAFAVDQFGTVSAD
jgi:hypothetical protein